MNNETQNPENNKEEVIETPAKTVAESLLESVDAVVDMMNSGKVDSREVYPSNIYQGD
jgi:hypothetical protein